MENSTSMQPSIQRQPFLNRVVPLMLLGFGALHLLDWAYGRLSDPWQLINGVGLLLMGGSHLAANRIDVANAPGRGRTGLLTLAAIGFLLAVAAIVHRWL
jgi:hypothetical protein